MLLRGAIRGLKTSFFPTLALLCLGIGASCARGTNESSDLANESPDRVNELRDVASESPDLASEPPDLARLESFLGNRYQHFHLDGDPPIRVAYDVAAIDLNGDDVDELLVYLRSEHFCGSDGCNLLILSPHGESFSLVAELSITRPPVRVLHARSNGWRNLTVTVGGGGILPRYESELAYNGWNYPTDPSMPPARKLEGAASGELLIDRRRRQEADGEFVIGEQRNRRASASCARGTIESADLARLQGFLSNRYQRVHLEGYPPMHVAYHVAAADLNGDHVDELLVYIGSEHFCGSGGCNLLILERGGEFFRVVTAMSITRPPIRALDTRSNGWRNLSVTVGGGGILPWYVAELAYDGRRYPSNPSMPPARRLEGAASGETLIDDCRREEANGVFVIGGP